MRVKHRAANQMFYFACGGLPQTSHDLYEVAPTYLRYKFGLLTLQPLKICFKPLIKWWWVPDKFILKNVHFHDHLKSKWDIMKSNVAADFLRGGVSSRGHDFPRQYFLATVWAQNFLDRNLWGQILLWASGDIYGKMVDAIWVPEYKRKKKSLLEGPV